MLLSILVSRWRLLEVKGLIWWLSQITSFFSFPWGRCSTNRAKFCMDRKTLPCLQNASQHASVYLQQFPSYSNHKCKKITIFTYADLHFLFALGTPLWQSRKTLHEWKDNSVLAKPLAACIHLSSTVSQLFEPQVQIIAFYENSKHIIIQQFVNEFPSTTFSSITQWRYVILKISYQQCCPVYFGSWWINAVRSASTR